MKPVVGVLALQGDFAEHSAILLSLGLSTREVRQISDLEGLSGLVLPGGESTAIALGLEREGLGDSIRELAAQGLPVLGTCAGMVLLGRERLGLIDASMERNAFGRQIRSFELDLDVKGIEGGPVRAVFIRAPAAVDSGSDVEVLAKVDDRAVALRQGRILVLAFHPELVGDSRFHRMAFGALLD